ncbi:disulfide bond formation protein B [Bordetella petrii]|uniref:disulfide bond formation protein B n=1 Tax=Bordetella petrii TaxID=94624 RepID=UPI001E4C53AF|nr:disulfide bond formation protein B [Bordetella petrii]MCD0505909.1 disulfide bond formation protein B [Bordetella petrii]
MIFSLNPARGSRIINTLVLLGISVLLYVAFAWQLLYGAAPCPLCLLQRAALAMAGVGLLLNIRLGPSPLHYAMVIAASLGGVAAAGNQLLAQAGPVAQPGPPPLLGLHLYSWAFLAFCALLVFCTLMLAADRKWGDNALKKPVAVPALVVMGLFLLAILANVAVTSLECGLGECQASASVQPAPAAQAR